MRACLKRSFQVVVAFVTFFVVSSAVVHAQENSVPGGADGYYRGEVVEVVQEGRREDAGFTSFFQELRVEILSGDLKGKTIEVEHGGVVSLSPTEEFETGDRVVVIEFLSQGESRFSILDNYRLPSLVIIVLSFFVLVILVAGRRGVGSILGLVVSFAVIVGFIVPQILAGHDPVLISIIGSVVIALSTMYMAHSFSRDTTVAVVSTFFTLVFVGILSYTFVEVASITGVGSEDTFLLQFGPVAVSIKGLFLGGMIIGALGVLDDITTSQTAAVLEIFKANPKLSFKELFVRGSNVGKHHVASLVNTLVLAYVGVSMALFIMIVVNPADQPLWVILNSEVIGEEVVRTIAGSAGLVLAVPITTLLACWYAVRKSGHYRDSGETRQKRL